MLAEQAVGVWPAAAPGPVLCGLIGLDDPGAPATDAPIWAFARQFCEISIPQDKVMSGSGVAGMVGAF